MKNSKRKQSPAKFMKDFMPNIYNNHFWYQKYHLNLLDRINKIKDEKVHTKMINKRCIWCGKNFKTPKLYYCVARRNGKIMLALAQELRRECCSDRCFYEIWNEVVTEYEKPTV